MECPLNSGLGDEITVGYVARTLDAQTCAAFERHMSTCARCSDLSAAQQSVWELLDAWPAPPVSSNFDEKLYRSGAIHARITA